LTRIRRAAERITGRVRRTPLLRSEWLSGIHGGEVWLKCENLQRTGSFKIRGALAAIGERGVIAASAGNHGLGLATAARWKGVPCTIVVPRGIPGVKEEKLRKTGARVIKSPYDGYDDTEAWAREQNSSLGMEWISAYDHPDVIAGNGGTTALEIFEERPDLDAVVAPCGGAGLAIGLGVAARAVSPRTRVIAVNTDASPALWASWRDGRAHTRYESSPTVAEGLEGGVSQINFERSRQFVDDVVVVRESAIKAAVGDVARHECLIIEGSAAAGVAAILEGRVSRELRRVALVLTGGNIDPSRLASLLVE
jgi:threonine dehydratase